MIAQVDQIFETANLVKTLYFLAWENSYHLGPKALDDRPVVLETKLTDDPPKSLLNFSLIASQNPRWL